MPSPRARGGSSLVTEEPLDYPLSESIAARNLVRAGFREAAAPRTVWRPPEELVAQDDDEDEDGLDEDDGLDDDHDFELEC